jgi:restriction system protein
MPQPRFNELFSDVLHVLSKDDVIHRREIFDRVAAQLDLTPEERAETNPGGGNRTRSRVHWALEYLCQAGAVTRPKRGFAQITDLGKALLIEQPNGVTLERLRLTEGLQDWDRRSKASSTARGGSDDLPGIDTSGEETPLERILSAASEIELSVGSLLLQRLREESPEFLEHAVLQLLHGMGYGSTQEDLKHLGGTNDGGVDGVIREDRFGLDQIYVQAKRYSSGTIGRPDVQGFVGALTGKRASRGVFITTSSFTKDAREYADTIQGFRVILVDGEELVRLMIEHKVGVTTSRTINLVEMDENFFAED